MDSLTPSDLFSPSKARQQRAQAQDWAHIDSWLSYKYAGRTVPTFERNDETLKVLRELSMANERADEERAVLERIEREALRELDEVQRNDDDERMLSSLRASLTPEGEQALDALASTAVALNTCTIKPEAIAHALMHNTTTSQNLTNQLAHIETLQGYVDRQQALLRTQLHELQTNPAFTTPPNLQRQTTEQTRQVKHLRAKIREYEDRLSSLQSSQSRNMTPNSRSMASAEAISEMLEQQKALDELRERVERACLPIKRLRGKKWASWKSGWMR
ncbi:haus augmin-like complex subunit 1 [Stemphylium lycopersici]|uniref:Haus augmin-like complex subunit 1 n=1 Tax=Stemphylium lycopersici TaxID=183478 RepID=A0A364N3J0_STELY|nr:haus augmin-like complex subunit 1 [Stemphylium lycopersici]RAR07254.1 haus augmin-like complex subunit 1 [Stemphylium lycopersici]RAR10574.1 haus augmin-like complex subunit 1 [Stemphylium lycopersici]